MTNKSEHTGKGALVRRAAAARERQLATLGVCSTCGRAEPCPYRKLGRKHGLNGSIKVEEMART